MLKVGIISVGFPNFRYDIAQEYLNSSIKFLKKEPVELFIEEKVKIEEKGILEGVDRLSRNSLDCLIIELGTYSYGSVLLPILEKIGDAHLILWSFREPIIEDYLTLPLNSLCALNMYGSFLKRIGKSDYSYIYGDIEEKEIQEKLRAILQALTIKKKLRGSKIAVIGGRVPGFYLSNVDELTFRKKIGIEIEYYSIASLLKDAKEIDYQEVAMDLDKVKNQYNLDAEEECIEKSSRLYLAIKKYAYSNSLKGFAFKCWPDLQENYDIAACGVIARLNNEGILTSCEGDITGLATMMIMQELTQLPVFLTDFVNVTSDNRFKLWHCGSASPGISSNIEKCTFERHPTMKQCPGLATAFDLKEGSACVCKLSEADNYKLLIMKGMVVKPDRVLTGNQGDLIFPFTGNDFLETIMNEGIEHHYCLGYDVDDCVLKEYCRIVGIKAIEVKERGVND